MPLFAAVSWVCRAGLGGGGGAFPTASQRHDEPQRQGLPLLFLHCRCWLLRGLYHRDPTGICGEGGLERSDPTPISFCSIPSEVCPGRQLCLLTGRALHLPGAACSAAAARPPALHGDLASARSSKHPASCFTPRLSRFIYTDRGCSETKEYFFFFFYVKDVLYFWKGCVSFKRGDLYPDRCRGFILMLREVQLELCRAGRG